MLLQSKRWRQHVHPPIYTNVSTLHINCFHQFCIALKKYFKLCFVFYSLPSLLWKNILLNLSVSLNETLIWHRKWDQIFGFDVHHHTPILGDYSPVGWAPNSEDCSPLGSAPKIWTLLQCGGHVLTYPSTTTTLGVRFLLIDTCKTEIMYVTPSADATTDVQPEWFPLFN